MVPQIVGKANSIKSCCLLVDVMRLCQRQLVTGGALCWLVCPPMFWTRYFKNALRGMHSGTNLQMDLRINWIDSVGQRLSLHKTHVKPWERNISGKQEILSNVAQRFPYNHVLIIIEFTWPHKTCIYFFLSLRDFFEFWPVVLLDSKINWWHVSGRR